MNRDLFWIDEIEIELKFLRDRNEVIRERLERQTAEIAELKKELSTKRKKLDPDGRTAAEEK